VTPPGAALEGVGTEEGTGEADGRGVRGVGTEVDAVGVAGGEDLRVVLARGVARVDDSTAPVGVLVAPGAVAPAPPPATDPELAGVGVPPLPPAASGVVADPPLPGPFVGPGVVGGFWLFLRAGTGRRSPGLIGPPAKLKPSSRTYPRQSAAATPSAQATHARRRPEPSTKTGEWITWSTRSLTAATSPHLRP
jgi:hypothetical protein